MSLNERSKCGGLSRGVVEAKPNEFELKKGGEGTALLPYPVYYLGSGMSSANPKPEMTIELFEL